MRLAIKLREGTAQDDDSIRSVLEKVLPGYSRGASIHPLISSQEPDVRNADYEARFKCLIR